MKFSLRFQIMLPGMLSTGSLACLNEYFAQSRALRTPFLYS